MAIVAGAYQAVVLGAAWRQMSRKRKPLNAFHPVSILKPVLGRDSRFYEAIRSHVIQDYPEYEILFGVRDLDDPAVPEIRRLMEQSPEKPIRLVLCSTCTPNGKVGTLIDLAEQAKYPLLLVNDSDILVPPDYLRRVVSELEQPGVGLVTCLYSARAETLPARLEAIGVVTEFAAGVLAAINLGAREFGLGATLLLRASDLRRIGGFQSVAEYLADDYQLGRRINTLGLKVALATVTVETLAGGETWGEVWRHQIRWARTIRVSSPSGYLGLPVTYAFFWSVLATFTGQWRLATVVLGLRILAGCVIGAGVLRDRTILRWCWLIPLRDLWGFAVWLGGLFGETVQWRGRRLRLSRDGRIREVSSSP